MSKIFVGQDEVKFKKGEIVVGCTTVSLEDVRKIAKQAEVECIKEVPLYKWTYECGEIYYIYEEPTFNSGGLSVERFSDEQETMVNRRGDFSWAAMKSFEKIS